MFLINVNNRLSLGVSILMKILKKTNIGGLY